MSVRVAALGLWLAGCPSTPNPSLDTVCARYTEAVCARLAECRGGPADAWCTRVQSARLCREVAASEVGGRTRYAPELAKNCLDMVTSLPCKYLAARSASELDVRCSEMLNGHVAAGGTCFADRECGLDFHCDRAATRCPGVCRRLRESAESCEELTGVRCNAGLVCARGTCTVPRKGGEACAATDECEAGLSCDGFAMPVSCQPERSDGPCRRDDLDCAPRSTCVGATPVDAGRCAVARQEGETCTSGLGECNELLTCSDAGTCVRWGGLGSPCGEVIAGERIGCLEGGCDTPFGSASGTCVFLDAGASCDLDSQCGQGGQCVGTPRACVPRCAAP